MRKFHQPLLSAVFSTALLLICSTVFSQSATNLNLATDTVAPDKARGAHSAFMSAMRKPTTYITFDAALLKEITDRCVANGITEMKFLISSIRKEDTAQYARRNPGLTTDQRNDLIGRQYLVIQVPRSQFLGAAGSRIHFMTPNALVIALFGPGISLIESPFDNSYFGDALYLSTGTICPPPASCSE